jgi:hypothetical protein
LSGPDSLDTDTAVRADWDSQKLSREEVMSEVRGSAGDIGPKPSKDRADRRQYRPHRTRNSNASGPMAAIEDDVSDHECRA